MIHIHGVVKGEKNVLARLGEVTPAVRTQVERTILRIVIDLQSNVVRNKLSGQLLKRRTGTLAASIQHKVVSTSDTITGIAGSRVTSGAPLKYAPPLEDGFNGAVTVKEHLRNVKQAWGKPMQNPRAVLVKAHQAQRNIKARHYMRSTLDENRDRYLEMIDKAVGKGARGTS